MTDLPSHASVVIVGDGIIGCSMLYHLAVDGVADAILIERNQLTSGEVGSCQVAGTCNIWTGDSAGDPEAVNNWVWQIVDEDGWPSRDGSVFILDDHYSEFDDLKRLSRAVRGRQRRSPFLIPSA